MELRELLDKPLPEVPPDIAAALRQPGGITLTPFEDKDAILVASYGVVGTGLTFKNIEYAIFGQSFKSKIINGQSLGRGLLKTNTKETFHIYDLIDILPTGSLQKQGEEKIKMYKTNKYEYYIIHK